MILNKQKKIIFQFFLQGLMAVLGCIFVSGCLAEDKKFAQIVRLENDTAKSLCSGGNISSITEIKKKVGDRFVDVDVSLAFMDLGVYEFSYQYSEFEKIKDRCREITLGKPKTSVINISEYVVYQLKLEDGEIVITTIESEAVDGRMVASILAELHVAQLWRDDCTDVYKGKNNYYELYQASSMPYYASLFQYERSFRKKGRTLSSYMIESRQSEDDIDKWCNLEYRSSLEKFDLLYKGREKEVKDFFSKVRNKGRGYRRRR